MYPVLHNQPWYWFTAIESDKMSGCLDLLFGPTGGKNQALSVSKTS